MITFVPTALSAADDAELRSWLGKSGAHLMRKIVESKLDQHLTEAIQPVLESNDYPAKLDAANAKLKPAHRYKIFLDVWKEFTDQPGDVPFQLSKLKQ